MNTQASSPNDLDGTWWRDFALFCVAVAFPSMGLFKKVGWLPLAAYIFFAIVGLYLLLRHILPAVGTKLNPRVCVGMVVVSFLLLGAGLYYIYPQILKGSGFRLIGIQFGVSDSNDAYMATWNAMFAGKEPYYDKSILGNAITPMPGALLIALPFYVLRWVAVQNIFWLVVFWMALKRHLRDTRLASVMMLTVMAISPALIYQILQGGDYMTNSIYVILSALFLLHAIQKRYSQKWSLGASAVLGLALSSRANYLLVLPILFFAVLRLRDFRFAVKHFIVVLAVLALVTMPFYLYDPMHFSPLHTKGKLDFNGHFPHAAEIIFFAGCALASILGFTMRGTLSLEGVCARMFIVQEFALLSRFALASLAAGCIDLNCVSELQYTLLSMFFGVFAFGPKLFRSALPAYAPSNQPLISA